MITIMALIIYTPNVVILKKIASHAVHIMILFLAAGMFFLIFDQKRLLFTAFACSAGLCLYFKFVANISINVPIKTSEPSLLITHTNTSELLDDVENNLSAFLKTDADIICLVEITPDWEVVLDDYFSETYPFSVTMTRIDHLGAAVFSKFPITRTDTIYYEDIPNLRIDLQVDRDHRLKLYCSNTNPPLYRRSFEQLRNQLNIIADQITGSNTPVMTCGNYNLDQFSDELQDFRAQANLNDSRKTMSPSLNPPTDHIFYSNALECLSFRNVYNQYSNRIGIIGEFQYINGHEHDSAGME